MNQEVETLAQRASVALATLERAGRIKSRWIAGMRGTRWSRGVWWPRRHNEGGFMLPEALPDLSDPLTVQALLLLVREASTAHAAHVQCHARRVQQSDHVSMIEEDYQVVCPDLGSICPLLPSCEPATTEPEALVNALEALAAAEVTR